MFRLWRFLVGRDAESGGIAKNGAKKVTDVSCAKVPKLTVIVETKTCATGPI